MTTKNKIITGFVVVILLIVGGYYFTHQGAKLAIVGRTGEPSGFDNINMTGSLRTGVAAGDINQTAYGNGSVSALGLYTTGALESSSTITTTSNIVTDNINSTSTTATSETGTGTDIIGYSTISMTPNTGALTYTLPASTTLATWLPNSGDSTGFMLYNATTTSAITVTIAAGTGTLLENGSSTAAILPSRATTVDVIRKPNSDFIFIINPNN